MFYLVYIICIYIYYIQAPLCESCNVFLELLDFFALPGKSIQSLHLFAENDWRRNIVDPNCC